MNSGKPDLLDTFIGLPKHGFKRRPRVINAEGMNREIDAVAQLVIREFEPKQQVVDEICDVKWASYRIHSIPNAYEVDPSVICMILLSEAGDCLTRANLNISVSLPVHHT